jgi:carbon monoxide dehydrogenase subunit G
MPVVEDQIEIDRPPDEVFDFISKTENLTLVNSNMLSYEQVEEEPRGKGVRDHGVVRVAGKKIEFTQEITEWEPGVHLGMRSLEAPKGMSWTIDYHLEDNGEGGTLLRFHQDTPSLGGFWGKLGDGLVVKMYTRDNRATLENTKLFLEEQ